MDGEARINSKVHTCLRTLKMQGLKAKLALYIAAKQQDLEFYHFLEDAKVLICCRKCRLSSGPYFCLFFLLLF